MTIYTGYREESVSYRRVRWSPGREGHLDELEDYPMITGGTLEFSASSALRASGTLRYTGSALPDTHDLVRIYYRFRDERGDEGGGVLGTFFPILSDPTHDMGAVTGSVQLQSVLRVPSRWKTGVYLNVPRNADAVEWAVRILEDMGIPTNRPNGSYRLARGMSFGPGTSYLEAATELLAAASYAAPAPDAMGGAVIAPLGQATQDDPLWTFEDGPLSIMRPEVVLANDSASTPNAVRLRHECEGRVLWASAVNDDPSHPASRPSRGYEDTCCETVSEVAGSTLAEKAAALAHMAERTLIEKTAGTEYVQWEHPWVPVATGDPVGIRYRRAGIEWRGRMANMRGTIEDGGVMFSSRAETLPEAGFRVTVERGWQQ